VRKSAITVYFPKREESLWSIAKSYNTTVESIALENNLEGDTTGELKMLFIPSV
jgi:LysM repeat protein